MTLQISESTIPHIWLGGGFRYLEGHCTSTVLNLCKDVPSTPPCAVLTPLKTGIRWQINDVCYMRVSKSSSDFLSKDKGYTMYRM